ncbi:MAG: hypothetical protein ACREJC_12685 [Tepidisphaeraceae bacterium]
MMMRLRSLEDIRVGARLLAGLPRFLRNPFSLSEARQTLDKRLANRNDRFLALVDRVIYRQPASVYRQLLSVAGCELADLRDLVARNGVEETLRTLYRGGVYLTSDEFKARKPLVRGGKTIEVTPESIRNPASTVHGISQTSGSRGARTMVPIDLAFIHDHAINTHLTLAAHEGSDWAHAHWGVPGGTALTNLLEFARGGNPPAKWFTPISVNEPSLHPRYRWGARAMRIGSVLAGVPLPRAELAPLTDPLPIVRWMSRLLREGRVPHVWSYASSAVRVCQAAESSGIDLRGARFTCGGEPTTSARRAAIERVGAVCLPRMGTTETDILSFACRAPTQPDDMHLLHDRHAIIQADGNDGSSMPRGALLVTSLLASAPVMMLNVCQGDSAVLEVRDCGCPLQALGWPTHIHKVRSYEKLTAGGMTFLDTDVIRVLEEVLPARFGGSPMDYQLLEEEGDSSAPRVHLLVNSTLGPLNEAAVADVFLEAIGGGDGGERLMEMQWRRAGVLRIQRGTPRTTASGKILHLHLERPA